MSAYKLGPTGRIVLSPAQRHTSVLLEHQLRQRPDSPFLTIEGQTYSYRATHERVMRVAAGLAGLGVTEGSRIGLLLPNVAAFVFLWCQAGGDAFCQQRHLFAHQGDFFGHDGHDQQH